MVIWLIGLAGAGKTTIGREVYDRLKQRKPTVVFLDGDHVRRIMGNDLGHTVEDRRQNAWRICHLCEYLDSQGIDVVCSILSLFQEHQNWNRQNCSAYFEVYIDVTIDELAARDQKGLYSEAFAGRMKNVVGVDIPFTPPQADLVVPNNRPLRSPAVLAEQIVNAVKGRMDDDVSIRRRESA